MKLNDTAARVVIEGAHIVSDMMFLRRLFQGIIDHVEHASLASLCVMNYVCLLTFESARHIKKLPPGILSSAKAPSTPAIAQSRHTVKLFDDNERGLAGVTGILEDEVIPGHAKEFLGNTWLVFARFLETDLGLFSYADRLIATTHSITYNLGMPIRETRISDLGPAIRDVATECSRFVDSITQDRPWYGPSFLDRIDLQAIRSKDVRASRHYRLLFDSSIPLGLRASLESFQASLNFLNTMLSADPEPASQDTICKLKYVTLRHTYSSLEQIFGEFESKLSVPSRIILKEALTVPDEASALKTSDNRLRNVLVHYGLGRTPLGQLDTRLPLFGLVETLIPGHTFDSFASVVDREVGRVSDVMNKWARK